VEDTTLVYTGLYLEAVTCFEKFIEDLFIGLLCGTYTHSDRSVNPRVVFRSSAVCRAVIHGERSYVDWLPYEKYTLKRAKGYFTGGTPFSGLTKPEKKQIERLYLIRNAIAHKSVQSRNRFEADVLAGLTLLPREKTPAGFLRNVFATAPLQTRYEEAILDMATIAKRLV
jgi:hypothetical protein